MKILQQNICWNNDNVVDMMNVLLKEEPDILLFSEFAPQKHRKTITEYLNKADYKIVMPEAWNSCKLSNQCWYTCVCMMAVNNHCGCNIQFEPIKREEIALNLRYIAGTLKFGDMQPLHIFFIHAPQTIKVNTARMENKAEMIFSAYRFLKEHANTNIFIGGDFNIAMDGTTTMENLFKVLYREMIDTDTKKTSTWKNKRLDYALVSSDLKNTVKTTTIETSSDHKALLTEIAVI